jgi:hypothetical protein
LWNAVVGHTTGVGRKSRDMTRTFEVLSGRRALAVRDAPTAQQALVDYVRGLGVPDDEIVRLGPYAVAWRGAVYKAAPVSRDRLDRG